MKRDYHMNILQLNLNNSSSVTEVNLQSQTILAILKRIREDVAQLKMQMKETKESEQLCYLWAKTCFRLDIIGLILFIAANTIILVLFTI
jgi:hypothetical protein